jgi:hypothetical protein
MIPEYVCPECNSLDTYINFPALFCCRDCKHTEWEHKRPIGFSSYPRIKAKRVR